MSTPRPLTPVFLSVRERLLGGMFPEAVTVDRPSARLHAPITRHAGKLKINKYQKPATPNIEGAIELHRLDTVAAPILLLIETTCQYAVLMAFFTGLPMHGPHRELTVPSRASRKTQFTVQMTESNTLDNACCAPKFRRMMSS